jgi:hypothetical protein
MTVGADPALYLSRAARLLMAMRGRHFRCRVLARAVTERED